MKVPFTNLQAHHAPLRKQISRVIHAVIDKSAFSGGPFVEAFEREFAAYCGTSHAVAVGSGTDALLLTLVAAGIGPGDEVITVPMSFFATAEAISLAGARPVYVDVDPQSYNMDPAGLARALTSRTKAIVPVHLFGQPADMDPINGFARKHGLLVIEDAAQSHGATYHGRKAGSLADAGCFSFFPGKNLGALGEGGAVVTNDEVLAAKIRLLREHGQSRKHEHAAIGWNSRMDGIQAAVLSVKLPHLERNNRLRQKIAARYDDAFTQLPHTDPPAKSAAAAHVYHVYAIQVPNRGEFIRSLERGGIGYGIHYPVPIHLQPAYAWLGHRPGDFPVAEKCAARFVSLPIYPEMTDEDIRTVVEVVEEASGSRLVA